MNTRTEGGPRPPAAHLWAPEAFLEDATFAPVVEINEQALLALRDLALGGGCGRGDLPGTLRPLWEALDEPALRRAARCPYSLVDAGFADPGGWLPARSRLVCDGAGRGAGFFPASDAQPLARLLLTYAWHLARTQRPAARLVLGMSAPCAEAIAQLTLARVCRIADREPECLAPRWSTRVDAWRQLLEAAISGESMRLEQAQLRGLQMLAGEAWRAARQAKLSVADTR